MYSMSDEILRGKHDQYTFDVTHTTEATRELILNGETQEGGIFFHSDR